MSTFKAPVSGLFTAPNIFSASPDGSCAVLNNVGFSAPSVLEPRRGMGFLPNGTFGNPRSRAYSMVHYGDKIVIQYDSDKLSIFNGANFTDFSGSYQPVIRTNLKRMPFVKSARNLYFPTATGTKALIGPAPSTVVAAGNPPGLQVTAVNYPTYPWQPYNTAVAYRYELCSKDSYGRITVGAPSGRCILINKVHSAVGGMTRSGTTVTVTLSGPPAVPHGLSSGDHVVVTPGEPNFPAGDVTVTVTSPTEFHYTQAGAAASSIAAQDFSSTRSVNTTVYLPNTASTTNFVRLYRSDAVVADPSNGVFTPSDDMYLAYETPFLTAGELAAGYLNILDITPESMLGDPLDTSANIGAGILQAAYQPPIASDMCYWDDRMWFGNTSSLNRLSISLIGTGTPNGLQEDDTVTITDGVTSVDYTAKAAGGAYPNFQLFTAGTPSENIKLTSQALIQAINLYSGSPNIYAYYASTDTGIPGSILLEERSIGSVYAIFATASRATCWNPPLPTSGNTIRSDNNHQPHGLSYSILGVPDAVPLVNYMLIDSANYAILAIKPLANKLYVFKENGIWFIYGTYPYVAQKLSAARLIGIDSVGLLGEKLYAFTDQGMVCIGDSGVEVLSIPIESDIMRLFDAQLSVTKTLSFGIGYESDRRYICWVPGTSGNSYTPTGWVYSTLSQGWTQYNFGVYCADIKLETDMLYVAPTDTNQLLVERKSHTSADYCDRATQNTIVSVNSTSQQVVLEHTTEIEAGDAILDTEGTYLTIMDVSTATNTVTLLDVGSLAASVGSTRYVYQGIPCSVRLNPITQGDPAYLKNFRQASLLFGVREPHTASVAFKTEISAGDQLIPVFTHQYGIPPYGDAPWGDPNEKLLRIQPLPSDKQVCAQLTVGVDICQAGKKFQLIGIAVESSEESEASR